MKRMHYIAAVAALLTACKTPDCGKPVTGKQVCTINSTSQQRIDSTACGTFGVYHRPGATVRYAVFKPAGKPVATAVLFGGGQMSTGISGNEKTGELKSAGKNFLVRSAQLFAEGGVLAIVIDRPSDVPEDKAKMDAYRDSAQHRADVLSVIKQAAPKREFIVYVGTSRGTISAFVVPGAHAVALTAMVSDGNKRPYLGDSNPLHQPTRFKGVVSPPRILVMHNPKDACWVTLVGGAWKFAQKLRKAGLTVDFDARFKSFGMQGKDPCGALSRHGFWGIEREAVAKVTNWIRRLRKH